MAHHSYLIRFSNGFKRYVSRQERDMLGKDLERIGPGEYFCKASIQASIEANGPHYLPGSFITVDSQGKRTRDLMESTVGMIARLQESGVLA